MPESKCRCNVCWGDLSIDQFRSLRCGHCLCITCLNTIQRTPPAGCPECRAPISAGDPQAIYLNIVAAQPLESVVADGVGRMDQDSKLVSVRTAERKLIQVAEQPRVHPDALESLLGAIDDFKKRIVPIFTKAKSQQTEIATLKKQLEDMAEVKAQADKATTLSGEVAILRTDNLKLKKTLHEANTQRDRAIRLAEEGKAQVVELRGKAETAATDAQGEIRRLKGYLEQNAEDRSSQKARIHGLQVEKQNLENQLDDLSSQLRELQDTASSAYTDDLEIEEEVFPSEYSLSSPNQASVSSQSTRGSHFHVSPLPTLNFEGMPRPGFGTDWQLGRGTKRKAQDAGLPQGFPIALSHGRTTIAVQLGPKHARRVKAR
ncbi:hypothetical protein DFH07DRAFT_792064 [Mycena maculata]|uniref:RING-type domain-containing protein n=1 Tax=Mycena maculata TaxID=230809 RepID=A0AAD7NZX1_9AGAR|nr:hypothetical protein DFH07DRAFT_792064 [Mycena maculata]